MKPILVFWGLESVLFPAMAAAQQQSGYHYGPGMMGDGGWFGMVFGPLVMILLIAAVIVLVIAAMRWLDGGSRQSSRSSEPTNKTPLDILEERFARGEIDKEEFEERRRLLRDD